MHQHQRSSRVLAVGSARSQLDALCTASTGCELATLPPLQAGHELEDHPGWAFTMTQSIVHHKDGAFAVCAGNAWFLNGYHGNRTIAAASTFNPKSQVWAPAPTPRPFAHPNKVLGNHGAAVYLEPYLYLIGGLWGYVTMFPGVHRINVIKHYASEYAGWERVADVLTTRRGHVCGAVVGKVYCVHGRVTYDGSKNPNDPMTFTNTMEVFDPATGKWSKDVPPAPGPGRDHAVVAVHGDVMFVLGGTVARPKGYGTFNVDTVEAFDAAAQTWSTLAPMPFGMASGHVAVVDSSVFWLGGHLYNPGGSTYVSTDVVWRYDITGNSWTCLDPMPMPMGGGGAIASGNYLYSLLGGDFGSLSTGLGVVLDVNRTAALPRCPQYSDAGFLRRIGGEFPNKADEKNRQRNGTVAAELATNPTTAVWYHGSQALPPALTLAV